MKTISFTTEVGADGMLRLNLGAQLPPGRVEGVVVVQATGSGNGPPFDTFAGLFKEVLDPNRDLEADLREMNGAWEKSVELPE